MTGFEIAQKKKAGEKCFTVDAKRIKKALEGIFAIGEEIYVVFGLCCHGFQTKDLFRPVQS